MVIRFFAALLVCIAAAPSQTLPRFSKQQVDEAIQRTRRGLPFDRASTLGSLISHNMISPERCAELAAEVGSQADVQADPAAHATTLTWHAEALRRTGSWEEATVLWSRARILAIQSQNPAAILSAMTVAANAYASNSHLRIALELYHEARDELRRGDHNKELARCLFGMAQLATACHSRVTAISLYKEIVQLFVRIGNPAGAADAILNQVRDLRRERQLKRAQLALRTGIKQVAESRNPHILFSLRLTQASLLFDQAKLDAAEQLIEKILENPPTDRKQKLAAAHILRGRIRLKRGQLALAEADLQRGIEALQPHQPPVWLAKIAQAKLLIKQQQTGAAAALFQEVAEESTLRCPRIAIRAFVAEGRLAMAENNHERAARLMEKATRRSEENYIHVQRIRSRFQTSWHDLEQEARAHASRAERRELADRAEFARQKFTLRWAVGVGSFGIVIVLLAIRLNFRRRIAEAKRASAEQHADELSVKLDDRTNELRTEMEERRELELTLERNSKSEAIAALASGVAHDFNNLMTIVIGSNELILMRGEDKLDSEDRQSLLESTQAAQSGAVITRELLEMARNRATAPELVDIEPHLQQVRGMLDRTVGESIELRYEFTHRAARVFVRKAQLTTALINLCSNARDAMASRGVITVRVTKDEQHCVHLTVKDSGHGMTAEEMIQARLPLYTTKVDGKGTGLGLSVVDRFASESHGSLRIESAPGTGTEVTLQLPSTPWEDEVGKFDVATEESPELELTGVEVLVVDDNGAVLDCVARALTQMGARVHCASSADQAQDRIDPENLPDVLLCDIRMPGQTNGVELAQWMRRSHPAVPVVLMSGYNDQPAVDFPLLPKPFAIHDLTQALRSATRKPA